MTFEPPFWKAYVKSVIMIYNYLTFNELRNLTLNDSKFLIWPQNKIFYWKLFSDFIEKVELSFVKIDQILHLKNKGKFSPEIRVKTRPREGCVVTIDKTGMNARFFIKSEIFKKLNSTMVHQLKLVALLFLTKLLYRLESSSL